MITIYLLANFLIYNITKKYAKQDVRLIINILSTFLTIVAIGFGNTMFDFSIVVFNTKAVDLTIILLLLLLPSIYHLILIVINKKESIQLEKNFLLLCLLLSINSVSLRSFLVLIYSIYSFDIGNLIVEIKNKYIPITICAVSLICNYQLGFIVYTSIVLWAFISSIREKNSFSEKQLLLFFGATICTSGNINSSLAYLIITLYLIFNLLEQLIDENKNTLSIYVKKSNLIKYIMTYHSVRVKRHLKVITRKKNDTTSEEKNRIVVITRSVIYQQDLTFKLGLFFLILLVGVLK